MNEQTETNEQHDTETTAAPAPAANQAIVDALAAKKPVEALTAIKEKGTDKTLGILINAFIVLYNALGAKSPAVEAQKQNLLAYVPKAVRAPAAEKWTPKLALNKAVKAKPIDTEALEALSKDSRCPADMANAIVSYLTVLTVENVPAEVVELLLTQLRKKGMVAHTGSRKPAVAMQVEHGGIVYPNLMGAIKGAGFDPANKVGESARPETELVWGRVRPQLLKDEVESYEYTHIETGKVYTFTKVQAEQDEQDEQTEAEAA